MRENGRRPKSSVPVRLDLLDSRWFANLARLDHLLGMRTRDDFVVLQRFNSSCYKLDIKQLCIHVCIKSY